MREQNGQGKEEEMDRTGGGKQATPDALAFTVANAPKEESLRRLL